MIKRILARQRLGLASLEVDMGWGSSSMIKRTSTYLLYSAMWSW